MQKAINVEAKMSLKSSIIVQDLDICYPRSYIFFNAISTTSKVKTQGITTKESHTEKNKAKKTKPADSKISTLPYSNEIVKLNC